jgi:integrase
MATRQVFRLTPLQVQRAKEPGWYPDGAGLYLQVGPTGGKSWIFRYKIQGRSREMGLGAINALSLAEARKRAETQRTLILDRVDPIDARKDQKRAAAQAKRKAKSFNACADEYIESHRVSWKNAKHADQWTNTLHTYASPIIGKKPVDQVDMADVIAILDPIWRVKPETASRLRGRIERILDWATVRGHRQGENPAAWRGRLESLFPAKSKVRAVEHHAALPYNKVRDFLSKLRKQEGISARCLEFTILTAARTGEAVGARWDEINLKRKVWIIPAERMKAKKEHRVPLSDAVIKVLKKLPVSCDFVFAGLKDDTHISDMSMLAVLKRMGLSEITVHGFRSTFRDWSAEQTNFPRDVCEAALAHTLENKTEASYFRADLFEKRRELMESWARFCAQHRTRASGKRTPTSTDR